MIGNVPSSEVTLRPYEGPSSYYLFHLFLILQARPDENSSLLSYLLPCLWSMYTVCIHKIKARQANFILYTV